jgi:hypothetical protein
MQYEIIVVDNESENTLKINNEKVKISVIKNKSNVGFGTANNQAVKKAKGEYVLFLNVDTEVLDDAITKLFTFIKGHTKVDIAGGKLINTDYTDQPSAGPFYSLLVTFSVLFLKGDRLKFTRYSPATIKKVDWVSGACILMKKSSFQTIGGFDENIFMYMDEIDLLYRAKKIGLQVYFYPDARFIHIGSATNSTNAAPIINIYKGLRYFYKKHANGIQYSMLGVMLFTKAWIAIVIGGITGNTYLVNTYRKALSTV